MKQDPTPQIDALTKAGCSRIRVDRLSGAKAARPAFDDLQRQLRLGDVVVTKLDRLGRSLRDLVNILGEWVQQDIGVAATDQQIDTTTAAGRMVVHVIAAVAEFERELIVERTNAALAARRERGALGGRPPKMTKEKLDRAERLLAAGATLADAAAAIGVGRSTLAAHRRVVEPA